MALLRVGSLSLLLSNLLLALSRLRFLLLFQRPGFDFSTDLIALLSRGGGGAGEAGRNFPDLLERTVVFDPFSVRLLRTRRRRCLPSVTFHEAPIPSLRFCLLVTLAVFLSFCLLACLPVCLPTYLSIAVFFCLSLCLVYINSLLSTYAGLSVLNICLF